MAALALHPNDLIRSVSLDTLAPIQEAEWPAWASMFVQEAVDTHGSHSEEGYLVGL